VSNVEPRLARERPVQIRRPWDDPFATAKVQAPPPPSEDPVYHDDGGVTAVGAVAAMKAMGGGAIRFAVGPDAAPSAEGGVNGG